MRATIYRIITHKIDISYRIYVCLMFMSFYRFPIQLKIFFSFFLCATLRSVSSVHLKWKENKNQRKSSVLCSVRLRWKHRWKWEREILYYEVMQVCKCIFCAEYYQIHINIFAWLLLENAYKLICIYIYSE